MSNIQRNCSPEVEYLIISCRPHHLRRVFSSILFVAVYLPPHTNASTKTRLNKMYKAISKQENAHPEAVLLVARDCNAGKQICFISFLPACHMCSQRGKKPLEHLYSTHRDTYKALPRPPFGKSDHNYILLIPAYNLKLKQEVPVTHSIQKWSDDTDATLQDCFASTDWNMFLDSSDGIEHHISHWLHQ